MRNHSLKNARIKRHEGGYSLRHMLPVTLLLSGLITAFLLLSACVEETTDSSSDTEAESITVAIKPTSGQLADGTLILTQTDAGVKISGRITGLTPGKHGFHVHENGDCSNNAKAAGGHFNPEGHDHGKPTATSHIGDLGNITADATGAANIDLVDADLSLSGEHSILGKAFVVHQGADDLSSQPSGAAGPRVGCGVIN